METLRHYVFSVICVVLICTVVSSLVHASIFRKIMKLLCGTVITIAVIQPFSKIDIENPLEISLPYDSRADEISEMGTQMAREAMSDIIKSKTEAYVLDKAEELGASVTINITIGSDCIPLSACISGEISPETKIKLENILEIEAGITKENQRWTG